MSGPFYDTLHFDDVGNAYAPCGHWGLHLFRRNKVKAAPRKPDAIDVWFAFYGREISIHQLRAQLLDLGWTPEEIEDGLDDAEDENE